MQHNLTGSGEPRVLLAGPAWIGDMIMAHSLVRVLHTHSPDAIIDMLAPGWSLPVIRRMPYVHHAIELPTRHGELALRVRYRLGKHLRDTRYDHAIVTPRSFKAALVPFFARIPRRTGFRGEMRYGLINDVRELDKTRLPQTVQRLVALGLPPDAPVPDPFPMPQLIVSIANQQRFVSANGLGRAQRVVGLMPGAEYGPAKCWPHDYFAQLAARLVGDGRQVWVFGSDADRAAGGRIVAGLGDRAVNLCGRTRLEDAIDLLALTEQVVTNDSGLMHVAAAVGTRVVALYGSTTPDFTPPLTDNHAILRLGLECSPCFARRCPLGHLRCLRDLSVDQVYAALANGAAGA